MSEYKQGKYFAPEEKDESIISPDKSQIHKEAVRDDLNTSLRSEVIRQQGYPEPAQSDTRQPSYHAGQQEHVSRYGESEQYNYSDQTDSGLGIRQTESREPDVIHQAGFGLGTRQTESGETGRLQEQHKTYSNAERFSHINDVKETYDPGAVRYGTVEKAAGAAALSGGALGAASISGTAGIIKTEDRRIFTESIKDTVTDSIKNDGVINPSRAGIFADSVLSEKDNEKKGVVKTVAGVIAREVENAVGQGGSDGDITDRAKGQALKYGYKTGKYTIKGGAAIGRGTFRVAQYGKRLSEDVAAGVMTSSAAKKALLSQTKASLTGSGVSLGGIIKTGAIRAVEDFHGSDDLGMQAITKPKDVIVKTKRSLKMAKSAGRSITKGVKTTKKTAQKVQHGAKAVYAAGKKVFTNPVVLKGIAIVAIVIACAAVIMAISSYFSSMFSALSLKSEDYELSQTYLYITELDARMEYDIDNEDQKWHFPEIDTYKYYLNGVETTKDNMKVCTDADLFLAYLDSKYEDYTFDEVKGYIDEIHGQLYKVEKVRWTEEIEHESTSTDPVTGETVNDSWTETVYHMDIYLTSQSFENYLEANKDTLLTKDQQDAYSALAEAGVYTFRQELSSPFVGVDWSTCISDRWGWRIHPITGELKQHLGLDIAMPGGTPINACMSGTVEIPPFDSDGYGNYVKIVNEKGDYTLYGHMSVIAVSDGQQVNAGDVIGYVGTTGGSTGNHLHLEYHKDGQSLNPLIFTECDKSN